MAQNIFDATFDANNRIDVNSFDWSHVNNLTTNFGRITPVFCELVPAKGSLRINPEFGLELMPMVFPVQTRMFARLNFFKVTLRSMWEDYSDFISNFRDDLEEPYILPDAVRFEKMLKTNTLGDYLGIPTQKTSLSNSNSSSIYRCTPTGSKDNQGFLFIKASQSWDSIFSQWTGAPSSIPTSFCATTSTDGEDTVVLHASTAINIGKFTSASLSFKMTTTLSFGRIPCRIMIYSTELKSKFFIDSEFALFDKSKTAYLNVPLGNLAERLGVTDDSITGKCCVDILIPYTGLSSPTSVVTTGPLTVSMAPKLSEVTYENYPFKTKTNDNTHSRLLAYRFRAYESVYNAYYRDIRNNPFVVNGRPVYNKWLPTTDRRSHHEA